MANVLQEGCCSKCPCEGDKWRGGGTASASASRHLISRRNDLFYLCFSLRDKTFLLLRSPCADLSNADSRVSCMIALLYGMPDVNLLTTLYLIKHLKRYATFVFLI